MNVSYFRNKYEYICSVSPSMSPGSLKQVEAPSPGPGPSLHVQSTCSELMKNWDCRAGGVVALQTRVTCRGAACAWCTLFMSRG